MYIPRYSTRYPKLLAGINTLLNIATANDFSKQGSASYTATFDCAVKVYRVGS